MDVLTEARFHLDQMRKYSKKLEEIQEQLDTEQDPEKWEELYEKEFELVMGITAAYDALDDELKTLPAGNSFIVERLRAQAQCIIGERLEYS